MPQSFTKLYAHLIFSTKNREPLLNKSIRPRVHGYMATLMRNAGSPYVVVGGVEDHVHNLFDQGRTSAPATFVELVTRDTSKFIKTFGGSYSRFYWQRGSSMFSVSPTHLPAVEAYVRNQEEHHRTRSFQDEVRDFLQRYDVTFDERYVWE